MTATQIQQLEKELLREKAFLRRQFLIKKLWRLQHARASGEERVPQTKLANPPSPSSALNNAVAS